MRDMCVSSIEEKEVTVYLDFTFACFLDNFKLKSLLGPPFFLYMFLIINMKHVSTLHISRDTYLIRYKKD